MIHGAFTGFDGTFFSVGMESSDINAKTSSPFYLASKNIDVWGIDMGWTMVPDDTTDFSFMEGWGYEKDADHTLQAMGIARTVRGMTGQGFSALNLLGHSSGNTVAYAAANKETQENNMSKRHVKGIISSDNAFKTPDGDSGCAAAQDVIDSGVLENTNGQFFQTVGYLAHELPNEASPFFYDGDMDNENDITNIQAFRLILATDAFGFGFKFFGGDFGTLYNSDEERATRAIANFSHYMPNQLWSEIDAVNCTAMNVTFDDHIGLISVPIFYIGAEIGVGTAGEYTSSLTSSTDITNHIVTSFGHMDMLVGDNSDNLVWSNLRNWLKNHQ
jgi:pimeloyl-ACP methyl ester carboxylesterase